MRYTNKRWRSFVNCIDSTKLYGMDQAITLLKSTPPVKFDQTMEFSAKLNIDPKNVDQNIRGFVKLPHGSGKKIVILAFVKKEREEEAIAAGAHYAGSSEFVEKISDKWFDFTHMVVTPDMMRILGPLGKILGPRGLMPSAKMGNVSHDITMMIKDIKEGKIEFKSDKNGTLNVGFGKFSFSLIQLNENLSALITSIYKHAQSGIKGRLIKSCVLSSTMGPGVKVEL